MDNKKLLKLEIIGTLFLIIMGSVMHFTYSDLFHYDFVKLIAPINESVWEHMKLAYLPLIIFSIFEYFILKLENKNKFVFVKAIEMYVIIISTAVLFYTYSGILGYNLLLADILTFIVAVIIGQYVSYQMLKNNINKSYYKPLGLILAFLLIFFITLLTFIQPQISLFISKG